MNLTRSGLTRYTLGLPVILSVMLCVAIPDFRQPQNLINFSGQIASLLIVSLGQMFVTLTGGIDLSVGSVVSLASCIVATQSDPLYGVVLALAAGVAVGLVNGIGVAYAKVHPLVMTLSTATFLQGLCYVVLPIPGGNVSSTLTGFATGSVAGVPLSFVWCAAAVGGVAFVLARSRFGLQLFAVGSNPHSAWLNGVRVMSITLAAYVVCSLMAVVAGIYLTVRVSAGDPGLGAEFALESVAVVALGGVQLTGGVGSAAGVLTGTLALGLLSNGFNLFGVSPFLTNVLTGLLLLGAVSMQRRRVVGL
jgi:ribose transport system permease protein